MIKLLDLINEAELKCPPATQDIGLNQYGYVTSFGLVRDIDTRGGAEAWVDGQLAGGLYCVSIGRAVYGESRKTNKI